MSIPIKNIWDPGPGPPPPPARQITPLPGCMTCSACKHNASKCARKTQSIAHFLPSKFNTRLGLGLFLAKTKGLNFQSIYIFFCIKSNCVVPLS